MYTFSRFVGVGRDQTRDTATTLGAQLDFGRPTHTHLRPDGAGHTGSATFRADVSRYVPVYTTIAKLKLVFDLLVDAYVGLSQGVESTAGNAYTSTSLIQLFTSHHSFRQLRPSSSGLYLLILSRIRPLKVASLY